MEINAAAIGLHYLLEEITREKWIMRCGKCGRAYDMENGKWCDCDKEEGLINVDIEDVESIVIDELNDDHHPWRTITVKTKEGEQTITLSADKPEKLQVRI